MDKFIEASIRERFALNNLINIIIPSRITDEYTYTTYLTDIYSYDTYDCLLQFYKDGSVKRRMLIEIKIRDTHYDDLILESKKLNQLKKLIFDDITDIIYICVTPKNTYMFNISKLIKSDKLILSNIECNKATMQSRENKVNKKVYLLNIKDGIEIDYKFDEGQFKEHVESKKIEKIKVENKLNNNICLFDYLLKK